MGNPKGEAQIDDRDADRRDNPRRDTKPCESKGVTDETKARHGT